MPELPEVHTIVQDAQKYLVGAKVADFYVEPGYSTNINNKVLGAKIISVERIAKNILIELDNKHSLLIHLAMTGRLLLRSLGYKQDRFLRVQLKLEKKSRNFLLNFCDTRKFGKFELWESKDINSLRQKYGPDPINDGFTAEAFLEKIHSRKTGIKTLLLDQTKISGIGNAYATDALWIAKVHPKKVTTTFTMEQAQKLLEACIAILKEGIKNRGISMSDYVDLLGNKGKQQENFRIYQRSICPRCSTNIRFETVNGRGTYYCENCQNL